MEDEEINDEEAFYAAVSRFATMAMIWNIRRTGNTATPDEVIEILNERIEWVEQHKRAVEKYLRRRKGPTWVRVIEGSGDEPG